MKLNTKRNILLFIIFPALVFLFGQLGAIIHWIFAFLIFPLVIIIQILSARIRCPNCGVPVGWRKYKLLPGEGWSLFTKNHCEHCGYNFDNLKPISEASQQQTRKSGGGIMRKIRYGGRDIDMEDEGKSEK